MEAPGQHLETETGPSRRLRRLLVAAALVVVALLAGNGAYRAAQAVRAGTRGKVALLQAESELNDRHPGPARQHLVEAETSFRQVRSDLRAMGPLLPLARVTPFVRIQVKGVQAFADAGVALSEAGIGLSDSASAVLEPTDQHIPVSGAIDALRTIHTSLLGAVKALDVAGGKVASLNGYRLLGPIGSARDELATQMPRITARATSAESGLDALLAFVGGSGPRRYLFFSQNPEEVRPTGGFLGTYGVLVADGKQLGLERFAAIDGWLAAHPDAVVPPDQSPTPLRLSVPSAHQSLANANAVADWPRAAQVAADLWKKGGEAPVDGVLSVTPGFLARVISVVGPVEVPSYGETVDASNVVARFDFYTRQVESKTVTDTVRKDFVAELAQAVMQRLLSAPASQWDPLARAIGASFDAGEAMAWSTDAKVAGVLAQRGWDGALPASPGDFFYGAEFQYETKSGGGLRRTYDHQVDLHADGSAQVTTVLTIRNPQPKSPFNDQSVIYVTAYGPEGATLDPASDPPVANEPSVAGHPAAGWFRGAGPLSEATLKVVWDVPHLATRAKDGTWDLPLHWRRLPDHAGDVLTMKVNLPDGWSWVGTAPPPSVDLDRDVSASWRLKP
jgi:hypothetical protein